MPTFALKSSFVFVLILFLSFSGRVGHASDEGVLISTPLIDAIALGDGDRINALLAQGADVNESNSDGEAPLAVAAMAGNTALMKDLLRRGADIEHRALNGETALLEAAYEGEASTSLLLARGANACARNKSGQTALDLAKWAEKVHQQPDAARILRDWLHRHGLKCSK